MDSKQFDLFMKTLTAAFSSQSAPHPQMIPFESFDGRNEKFSAYLERFENYCELKNINENKKKAQLLCSSIGKECYNNLAAFLGPDQPVKEIEYSDLVTHFLKMLSPTVSTVVAQHYFLNITQQPQQSISDFVATLKGNLKDCDFYVLCPSASCKRKISIADTFLRAQFIRGLKDNWIREQLLQDYSDDKNFETLLKKATALEASQYESNQLTKPIDRSSDSLEHTHRVTRESRPHHRNRNPQQPHARNNSRPSSPHQGHRSPSHPRKHRVDYKALGINGFCLNCGRANHLSRDCRTDRQSLKCTACKRTGHVAKVCITTLLRNHRTHAVSSQNNTDEDQTSDNSYGVVRIEENLHRIGSDTDKYMVTVQLNGKPQIFEVDSGARFSLLSETDFNNLNLGVPVESTPVSFRSYSDHIIKPKGKVTLSVSYKNKTLKNDLYIVPHGYEALLGRMWIRGLGINLDDIDHCRPTLSRNPDKINMVSTALPNKKAFIPLNPSTSRVRSLQVGERVQARIFQDNHDIWKFGTVTKKLGQFHYIVELDDGRSVKRHINQLISSLVPKKHVTFAMPQLTQQRRGIPFLGDVPSAQPAPQIPLTPPAPPDLPTLGRNRRPPPYLRDYVTHF